MGLRLREQQSPAALGTKTQRAAGFLTVAGVGSVVTARGGDAPPSPQDPVQYSDGLLTCKTIYSSTRSVTSIGLTFIPNNQ